MGLGKFLLIGGNILSIKLNKTNRPANAGFVLGCCKSRGEPFIRVRRPYLQ